MNAVNFLDGNIFIYLLDSSDKHKQQRALELVQASLEEGKACISYQVVQETLNIMLRKIGVSTEEAHSFFNTVLAPLWTFNPTQSFYRRGLDVGARYQIGFYDSLIVAAALEAGCQTLYSEDLQHGQRIEKLNHHESIRGEIDLHWTQAINAFLQRSNKSAFGNQIIHHLLSVAIRMHIWL